jgi:hypothetical protein
MWLAASPSSTSASTAPPRQHLDRATDACTTTTTTTTTTTAGTRFASVDMARHLHDRGIVLARSGDLDQAEQALSASLAARPAWSGGQSPRIADLAEVQASGGEIEHAAGLATQALAIGVQTGSVEQRRRVLRPWSRLKPHPRASPCGSSASSSARSAWPRSSSPPGPRRWTHPSVQPAAVRAGR